MVNDLYLNAGKRIMQLRILNQYSREQLAGKAGISVKFLNNIEKGKQGFSAEVLYRLSGALHVKCDYIMGGEEDGIYNKEVLQALDLFDNSKMEKIAKMLRDLYEISL